MRVPLPVLGALLLCAAAVTSQEDISRGRGRLRELVQKARAGDAEAQALLASRRRKVVRKGNPSGDARNREQSAVAAILGGAAPAPAPARTRTQPTSTRQRGESVATRSRSRGASRSQKAEITTFRPATFPVFTPDPPTTEAPTLSPAVEETFHDPAGDFHAAEPADLTPTNIIPSMFQPAQFGPGGRGVQAESRPIVRAPRPQEREPAPAPVRSSSPRRPRPPHRAVQRGLETGSRSELINLVEPTPEEEGPRAPPVQTTRRYSYYDDAGNYVFGYEDEDGTFKEEIRGLDCIVNGKYGYIDPDGIRREFTYVSGNKCDPSNPESSLLPDGSPIPTGDQFLHQTQEQVLTDSELSALNFNRRRRPNQSSGQSTVAQRQPSRPAAARPRTRPAPEPQRFAPRPAAPTEARPSEPRRPADVTPKKEVPSLFKPAQFGSDGRGVAPEPDRFPTPDFIDQSSQFDSQGRDQFETRVEEPQEFEPRPAERVEEQQRPRAERPVNPPVDLTPTNVIPSLFQPAQFGPGGRGVQQLQSVTRPPVNFNFDQEFKSVFSHFDRAPRPTPRPTPPPTPRPTPPPTAPPAPRPSSSGAREIPSLFRPAQFNTASSPPSPPPPPPPPPPKRTQEKINSFSSASQSTGANQLVFDSSTGTFKTVQLQASGHFTAPTHSVHSPAPRPPPPPPSRPPPPAPQPSHDPFSQGGRALPIFDSSSNRNPLPPIPTSAAEFDRFFTQFPTAG